MQKFVNTLCIALFSILLTNASAQGHYASKPNVVNYSAADYKGAATNHGVAESKDGMLYFSNHDGLLEFDGTNWALYPNANNTILRSIDISDDGTIYAGGQNEIGYYKRDDRGVLNYHSLNETLPDEVGAFSDMWGTYEHEGTVFYQTFEYVFVRVQDRWVILRPEKQFTRSYMVDGRFFVLDRFAGIKEYVKGKLVAIPGTEKLSNSWLVYPFSHPALGLLFATGDHGVVRFKAGEMETIDWEVNSFLVKNELICAFNLDQNQLAFGTNHGGFAVANLEGDILQTIGKKDGLSNNTVNWVHHNGASNLWVCMEQGIDFVQWNGAFRTFIHEDHLSGPGYAAYVDENSYYLGTNKGAFYADRTNGDRGEFKSIEGTESQVWNFTNVNGEVFCGQNLGSFVLNGGEAYHIEGTEGVWDHVQMGSDPNKMVLGCYWGLTLIEKVNGRWQFVKRIPGIEETLRLIELDHNDEMWVSHPYKGIFRIKLSAELDTVEGWSLLGKQQGLPEDINNTVFKIKDEVLIGTMQGVYKYNYDAGVFEPHAVWNERLGIGWVRRMVPTERGAWFVKDGQIGLIEEIEGKWETTMYPQLQDPMIGNFEEFYSYKDETVLGTKNGFLHYVGNEEQNTEPNSFIRNIQITNADSTLVGGLVTSDEEKVILDYTHNALRFEYSGISQGGSKVVFRSQLVGYEDDWTDWTEGQQRGFTNLKEGHYEFQLQAAIPGEEGGPVTTFKFQVRPPWYRSLLAYGVYAVMTIILIILLEKWVKRRLEEQRVKLQEVANREKEAQQRELQLKEADIQRIQLEKEKELVEMRNQNLRKELEFQTKELGSTTMHIIQSNQLLETISENMREAFRQAENPETRKILRKLQQEIKLNFKNDDQWEQFELYFDKVHEDFLKRLKDEFPQITNNDLKLCAYLKMNLSTKEIAGLMNISVRGVESSRYRLRAKLDLPTETNLVEFIRAL